MMIPVVIGACVAGAAGFAALSFKRAADGNKRSMEKLAKALGLPLLRGEQAKPGKGLLKIGPRTYFILDLWHERELNLYHIIKGSGNMQQVSAALDVPVDVSKEFRMSLSSAGTSGTGSMLQGMALVCSGDAAFDTRFNVKSNEADLVQRILTPELRESFANTWNAFDVRGTMSVREGRVHYEESGWILTEAQRRRFAAVAGLANQLAAAISPVAPQA